MKLSDTRNAFGAALLLGMSVAAAAQQAPPQPTPTPAAPSIVFPSQVELVTVDAVVTDKKNAPIENLTKESFTVFEDGKPQEITSFEAVILPPAPSRLPEPPAPFPRTRAPRVAPVAPSSSSSMTSTSIPSRPTERRPRSTSS
jgi:hypothetical protein